MATKTYVTKAADGSITLPKHVAGEIEQILSLPTAGSGGFQNRLRNMAALFGIDTAIAPKPIVGVHTPAVTTAAHVGGSSLDPVRTAAAIKALRAAGLDTEADRLMASLLEGFGLPVSETEPEPQTAAAAVPPVRSSMKNAAFRTRTGRRTPRLSDEERLRRSKAMRAMWTAAKAGRKAKGISKGKARKATKAR